MVSTNKKIWKYCVKHTIISSILRANCCSQRNMSITKKFLPHKTRISMSVVYCNVATLPQKLATELDGQCIDLTVWPARKFAVLFRSQNAIGDAWNRRLSGERCRMRWMALAPVGLSDVYSCAIDNNRSPGKRHPRLLDLCVWSPWLNPLAVCGGGLECVDSLCYAEK